MRNRLYVCLEWIPTLTCKGLVLIVQTIDLITNLLASIFKFAIIVVFFVAAWHWIGGLPIFWQSLVLSLQG